MTCLLLHGVRARVLNEAGAGDHVLHALFLYLLQVALVLEHPAQADCRVSQVVSVPERLVAVMASRGRGSRTCTAVPNVSYVP